MTYASREVNDINIRKALALMQRNGITPNAIVSPLGCNDKGFSEAIKEQAFEYSSEFGYAVDDLPSFPNNDSAYPLQVPVHPGCSGVFHKAGFTEAEQFEHLYEHARRQGDLDGICLLYDHPNGGLDAHEVQFVQLFDKVSLRGYKYLCMSDYCRAWLQRPRNFRVLFNRGQIEVDGFSDNGFRLEQITDGTIGPVQWDGKPLPQVSSRGMVDEFVYPPHSIREVALEMGQRHLKQRNFSKAGWYTNEVFEALRTYSGYKATRRLLSRVRWLRALRGRMRH